MKILLDHFDIYTIPRKNITIIKRYIFISPKRITYSIVINVKPRNRRVQYIVVVIVTIKTKNNFF